MQHTYGIYHLNEYGLQDMSFEKGSNAKDAMSIFASNNPEYTVFSAWNADPGFNNPKLHLYHEKSKPHKVPAKTNMGR